MSGTMQQEIRIATFSVCADGALTELAMQLPNSISSITFEGDFQDYISQGQRPKFPPSMRTALGCIALIDFDRDPEAALETVTVLHGMHSPSVACVGISSQLETGLLLRAMRSGCSEFMTKPVTLEHMQETAERLLNRFTAKIETPPRGRVISLFGAKGGVGNTTLAVHVASYLAKQHGKKTLLIDHIHQLGHVCLLLGLEESGYHFNDLVQHANRLDEDLLNGFVVRHGSGLAVVSSPSSCTTRRPAMPDDIERIFAFLREQYDLVIIDSSLQYDDAPAIIQHSDEVYLVSTPDVAALRDLSRHIENLGLTEVQTEKLHVAINRYSSKDAINQEQIEKVVKFPVSIRVPNNYSELINAVNAGEPIWPQRRSEFTSQLTQWSNELAGGQDVSTLQPQSSGKRFGFWKTQKA